MEKEDEEIRKRFLKSQLEEYMERYSIDDINFFLSKTPEEMMQLPDFQIQLISYVMTLKSD